MSTIIRAFSYFVEGRIKKKDHISPDYFMGEILSGCYRESSARYWSYAYKMGTDGFSILRKLLHLVMFYGIGKILVKKEKSY